MFLVLSHIWTAYWIPQRGMDIATCYKAAFVITIALYLPSVWSLQGYMRSRAAYKLKWVTFFWNLSLAVISAIGLAALLMEDWRIMLSLFVPEGSFLPYTRSVMAIFSLSKPLEFGDTLILALKKKPVVFLHLYHHLTVALYCWHAQYANIPFAHPFAVMNLGIHSVMYFYYAAGALVPRHPILRTLRPFITQSQTLQMLIGFYVAIKVILNPENGGLNDQQLSNAWYSLVMYCTYVYLFANFYLENYVKIVRPVMTLFIGTVHVVAVVGAAVWWGHARRIRIGVELLIGYLLTAAFLRLSDRAEIYFRHGEPQRRASATVSSSMQVDNPSTPRSAADSEIEDICYAGSMIFNMWATWAREIRFWKLKRDSGRWLNRQPSQQDSASEFPDSSVSLMRSLVDKTSSEERESSSELLPFRPLDSWLLPFCILVPPLYGLYSHSSFFLGLSVHGCLRWVLELYTTDALVPNMKMFMF